MLKITTCCDTYSPNDMLEEENPTSKLPLSSTAIELNAPASFDTIVSSCCDSSVEVGLSAIKWPDKSGNKLPLNSAMDIVRIFALKKV